MKKKVAVVIGSFVAAGVIAVLGVQAYLRWQDPVGYRNLSSCTTIEAGATLEQLKAVLGEPVATSTSRGMTWLHFRTASIAAGPIRAALQPSTLKVIALRCSEDGPDTWSLEARPASNKPLERAGMSALRPIEPTSAGLSAPVR